MAKKQVIAIEVGTKTAKFVRVEHTPTSLHFLNAGIVEYAKNNDEQDITAAINLLWKDVADFIPTGIRAVSWGNKTDVVIALPRFLVSTKRLTNLPATSDEQLENVVAVAAETEMPFRVEDAIFTHHNVQRTESATSVELISTRRTTVERYTQPLENHRAPPSAIIPSMVAIAETVRATTIPQITRKNRIIADIGAKRTDFCFMQGDSLLFSRSFLNGGNHLTERVMEALNVGFETAEQEKRVISAREAPANAWTELFLTELRRTIDAAFREIENQLAADRGSGYEPIASPDEETEIWLCGGGARLIQLSEVCEETLDIPTRLWNPGEALKAGNALTIAREKQVKIETIESHAQKVFAEAGDTFAVVLGTLLNSFDPVQQVSFLPKEIKETFTQTARKGKFVLTAGFGAAAVVGILFFGFSFKQMQQQRANRLDESTRQFAPLLKEAKIQLARELTLTNMLTHHISPLDILQVLSGMFKERTKIAWSNFNISNLDNPNKTEITFNLEAVSPREINNLSGALNRSNIFTNIELGEVSGVTENKKQIFRIRVRCNLTNSALKILAKKRYPMPEQPVAEIQIGPSNSQIVKNRILKRCRQAT